MKTRLGLFLLTLMLLFAGTRQSSAQIPEAADRAYEMASKYTAMGYYLAPNREGWAGFGVTLEFLISVSPGVDYIFILAGDHNCLDPDVWIESEQGNVIVKDTRKFDNGLCGVRWRSDFQGNVNCVVHFARVTSRCAWAAVIGRRGTLVNPLPNDVNPTTPGPSAPAPTRTPPALGDM